MDAVNVRQYAKQIKSSTDLKIICMTFNLSSEVIIMSNRQYRLFFGAMLLVALYFELEMLVYFLIGLAVIEAITNLRIPKLISLYRYKNNGDPLEGSIGIDFKIRSNFQAERAWRILVATILSISIFVFPESLWFMPWFMGLAILGAGISGVCPMFLGLKWIGFK